MEIYLDNSATTRAYPEVAELVTKLMLEDYGNPSALHQKGVDAEQYLRRARETMAKILKVQEKEIYFTSGGTESNNWALVGTALAMQRMGKHIITTQIEHPAVQAPVSFLEEMGFTVTRLGVSREGMIDLQELEEAITPETILVSVMFVNNEIGSVEPVAEIGERIKRKNPNTVFHVDAIQAFGKLPIYPKKMNIDLLSVSGHKFHGPKGTGMLYIREKTRIRPVILGGGQQNGMRSGTENVPGAAGMALDGVWKTGGVPGAYVPAAGASDPWASGDGERDSPWGGGRAGGAAHCQCLFPGRSKRGSASYPGIRRHLCVRWFCVLFS